MADAKNVEVVEEKVVNTTESIEDAKVDAKHTEVAQRINELRGETVTPQIMSAIKRREKLTELANSDDPNVAMKAIDLLNKMDGEYVQKVEADLKSEITVNVELVDDE